MKLHKKITSLALTIAVAATLVTFVSNNIFAKSESTATALAVSSRPAIHKAHFSIRKNILKYELSGRVVVGQPNFQGALSVIFFTSHTVLPQLHIAINGVPMPDGSLSIRASMTELTLMDHAKIIGSVTSYTPSEINFKAQSSTGFTYYGQLNINVNALSNTFTGQLSLRPIR
ncbi:MAG: hypothetical protein M0019_02125 [Actinomycetota bacterium]|nr:hypothetical protein [Actinomycetota bacterium]